MANKNKKHHSSSNKTLFSVRNENAQFAFIEAYKMLRTNIEFISAASKCKKIGIVSSISDEGKSNVAVNLAYTLANGGKKVCVVDCDLRKPTMYKYFNESHSRKGLMEIISGKTDLDKALIQKDESGELFILLSGERPPNPSEILGSEAMKNVIDELEQKFDIVIFDTAPLTLVTDAVVLGQYLDGAIIVTRQNYSDKRLIREAKKNLDASGTKLIGAVITNYSGKDSGGYYKKGYSYYGKDE